MENVQSQSMQGKIDALLSRYPQKMNAMLPLLHLFQQEQGYLDELITQRVADICETSLNHVRGVITFYSMYAREERGATHIAVCTNLSCCIGGSDGILEHLEGQLGVSAGESTEDARFFLEEVECLGACGYAPVVAVDWRYIENATPDLVDAALHKAVSQKK